MKKKILIASSNPWNSVFQVGTHHLARELLKLGHEVAFISNPLSFLHLFKGREVKKRFDLYRKGGKTKDLLWAYVPFSILPPCHLPFLNGKWLLKNWHHLTLPSLIKKVISHGFHSVDILYFDTAMQSFWKKEIQATRTLFRVADQTDGFKTASKALLEEEKRLIDEVDIVLCSGKNLTKQIPKARHFPNGTNLVHFSKPFKIPDEIKKIPKPIAIYVGAIEGWFHFDLLIFAAKALPSVSFVVIGPLKKDLFPTLPNLYVLGPKEYEEIPNYIKSADVGLIPFNVERYPELIHQVNPLKLYEYMACSLPVVATKWEELSSLNSPAILTNTFDEFVLGIKQGLDSPSNVYREYAEKHDWSIRAKELLDLADKEVHAKDKIK